MLTDNTDDLDIQLLLTIQQACNASGVKIPWQLVADTMGSKFTEGAIIQHLSKLRTRRETEDKPVPPPLRRSLPSQGGSSSKKKTPITTPSKGQASPEKTPSKPYKGGGKKRLDPGSDSDDDPSWSQEEGITRSRSSGKRLKFTSKLKDVYEDSDEEDLDMDMESDDNQRMCVGASFLKFGKTSSKKKQPSNEDETVEEGKNKPSKMVLKLPLDPERLQKLDGRGSVVTPTRKETAPVVTTPTPAAKLVPLRSPSVQNPDWGIQSQGQHFNMQPQGQSSPSGYSAQSFPQSFAPVRPSPMASPASLSPTYPYHPFDQPIPQAYRQIQPPMPQHGLGPVGVVGNVHQGQPMTQQQQMPQQTRMSQQTQLPQQTQLEDDFLMSPRFTSAFQTTPTILATNDPPLPQLFPNSPFSPSHAVNTSGAQGLMHGSGLGTAYSGIGDQSNATWEDSIEWNDAAHDGMHSSPEPDIFKDMKMDN